MRTDFELSKVPPHNIEVEEALIASAILDPESLNEISVLPEYFYKPSHQLIFKAILDISSSNDIVDLITVSEKLRSNKKLDEAGGVTYLSKLLDGAPMAPNYEHYSKILKEKYDLRQLIKISADIIEKSFDQTKSTIEIIERSYKRMMDLGNDVSDTVSVRDVVPGVVEKIETLMQNPGMLSGLSTGFKDLDDHTSGFQDTDLILLGARPSMGKELTMCTDIIMSDGSTKKMGDIKIFDEVASVDGNKSFVTGVFDQGIKPIYEIKFSDGRSCKAGLDHQWEVIYRDWKGPRVLTTNQLIEKLKFKRYKNRLYIPRHSGDFGHNLDLPIHPYLLGVLIGDGGLSSSINLTTSYSHILEKIKPYLWDCSLVRQGNGITYRIQYKKGHKNPIKIELKKLGLSNKRSYEKFIPEIYLTASKKMRLELIRGLIDTDGTVEKTGAMTYSTSSFKLANDFVRLARSLGAYVSMSERNTKYTYKGSKLNGRKSYVIFISCKYYKEFVSIPHKKNRIKKQRSNRNLNVESIKFIGNEECRCISVSHDRCLYLVNDYIVTHNTALSLNICKSMALNGIPVLFFSLEMARDQIMQRMLSDEASINLSKIRSGNLSENEWSYLNNASSIIYDIPHLYINDVSGLTSSEIISKSRKMFLKHGIKFICIDYLQYVKGWNEKGQEPKGEILRDLKGLAKYLNIPVMALMQLNRSLEARADKRPILSDARDSGNIEQDGDLIMFLYRDDVYKPEGKEPDNRAELIIRKARQGRTATAHLLFEGKYQRFTGINREQNYETYGGY